MDAKRSQLLRRLLEHGARHDREEPDRLRRCLLVVDNAVSHAHELVEFTAMLNAHPRFVTSMVPVGKGEYLALSTG